MIDYEKLSDLELINLYQENEDKKIADIMIERYTKLIIKRASNYYLIGGDREDLIQAGRMGVFYSLKSFNSKLNDNYYAFVRLCINGALSNAINQYNRKKHLPLNESVSLDIDSESSPVNMEAEQLNPENIVMEDYNLQELIDTIENNLSDLEKEVMVYMFEGYDYKDIAKELSCTPKKVDNTIQRIKQKVSLIKNSKL